MSKKRLFLESAYFAPISSRQMREHYVNDARNIYVTSGDLGNDKNYVIVSKWNHSNILGYRIWYVFQTAATMINSQLQEKLKDIRLLNGDSICYDSSFNVSKITGMHSAQCEFESAEEFNIVKGFICNRFKNKKLHHKDLIEYKYPYNSYKFIIQRLNESTFSVTFDNLKENQIKWIIYQGAINMRSKSIDDYIKTCHVSYSFKDKTITQASSFNDCDSSCSDKLGSYVIKRLIYEAKINNIDALAKRCFM